MLDNYALSGSSGAAPRFVNDGEAMVGITLEDNAYRFVKGGGPVTIVYPEEGTSSIADGMALVKGASNPDGGKQFLNWMLSKEAQAIVAGLGRRSVRDDVKALGNLPSLSAVKLINYDIKMQRPTARAL
ncbi:MAG: extracellular solute-binding protein [Alphaproteobacteria bacterium]